MRRAAPVLLIAAVVAAGPSLAACGGRFPSSSTAAISTRAGAGVTRPRVSAPPTSTTATARPDGSTRSSSHASDGPAATGPAATAAPAVGATPAAGDPIRTAVIDAYEAYLSDLSRLDDTLTRASVGPLASVTTTRLAQASVRQAAALLAAHEHGVGTLRDDHVSVVVTGPASAALADCQDQRDFYLVSDGSGTPDPFVSRGDFAGSAQMVQRDGHWLVDVFTTTRVACTF